jgi:hypothetical protein
VASLAAELKENDKARLFLRIIRQAASSSFNALEQLLTHQLGVLRDISADSRLAGMLEDVVTHDLDSPVAAWKIAEPPRKRFFPLIIHSWRSAIMGSTFVARRAGIQDAARATVIISKAAPISCNGVTRLISKSGLPAGA